MHKLEIEAKRKFNKNFFKNFAFTGPDQAILTQKSLEEYIINMDASQDIQYLIVSMVTMPYELNNLIPNIEMIFYRIFCSPFTNIKLRKAQEKENLLAGNIFAEK